MSPKKTPREPRRWLDEPRNHDRIYYALVALCVAVVGADLFYVKHVHFEAENLIGAYGLYGFVGCVALVLGAKELRKLLMRDEDYYDDGE